MKASVGVLSGNKGEENIKIPKFPPRTSGYMVVTFFILEYCKRTSNGSKNCELPVSHTEFVLPLRFTCEEVKDKVRYGDP